MPAEAPLVLQVHHVRLSRAGVLERIADGHADGARGALHRIGEHVGVCANGLRVRHRDRVSPLGGGEVVPLDDAELRAVLRPLGPQLALLPYRLEPHEYVGPQDAVEDGDVVSAVAFLQAERIGKGAAGAPLLHERNVVALRPDWSVSVLHSSTPVLCSEMRVHVPASRLNRPSELRLGGRKR